MEPEEEAPETCIEIQRRWGWEWLPIGSDPVLERFARVFGSSRMISYKENRVTAEQFDAIMARFDAIEGMIGKAEGKAAAAAAKAPSATASAPKPAPAGAKKLKNIQEKQATIVKCFKNTAKLTGEPYANGGAKYNIQAKDKVGNIFKLGTFDKELGEAAMSAYNNKKEVTVSFGENASGYLDLADIIPF